MPRLFTYSSIITKLHAMESNLLSEKDYDNLCNLNSVNEFISYLKQNKSYAPLLDSIDENNIHRGMIEHQLNSIAALEFSKIYLFASMKQKRLLSILFRRFEADFLKNTLTYVYFQTNEKLQTSDMLDFFQKHSKLNLLELKNSESLEQFIQNLKGSIYYQPLLSLYESSGTLYDYQTTIDSYYFITVWNSIQKLRNKTDRFIYSSVLGTQIDLQNIMWTYRMKHFFNLDDNYMYSRLIPVHYKLSEEQLHKMVFANSLDEFFQIINETYYHKLIFSEDQSNLEHNFLRVRSKFIYKLKMKEPLTITPILYYLNIKEREVDQLTTILECIRYQVQPTQIKQYLSITRVSH